MSWSENDVDSKTRLMEPHRAGRTEYGVPNDDEENVEQQSRHVLVR